MASYSLNIIKQLSHYNNVDQQDKKTKILENGLVITEYRQTNVGIMKKRLKEQFIIDINHNDDVMTQII